jgi:hypothetical protein
LIVSPPTPPPTASRIPCPSQYGVPFKLVCAEHYGNWPQEATIDTSLVYYEKYINSVERSFTAITRTVMPTTGDGQSVST